MTYRPRLAVLLLFLLLSACTTGRVVLSEDATPTLWVITATPRPPLPTLIPTPTNLPDLAPSPSPNALARVRFKLPAPQPLTGQTPWLAYPCLDQKGVPSIANSTGSGCVPFTLPTSIPADRGWISVLPGRGSYAAFRVNLQTGESPSPKNAAYLLQPNGLDDQLYIVKLPENRIIRIINQIDEEGWGRIQKMRLNPPGQIGDGSNYVPLPVAVILDPESYHWSADGRYLAYTGVDKIGTDLFVYDSLTDTIRRMSRGRQGASFWDWSPDGMWILYHEMAGCDLNIRCQMKRGLHYFAVTFPPNEYQFSDNLGANRVDWIANNRYLVQGPAGPDQLHKKLVEVDLNYGTVATLYNEPYYAYTYVPNTYVTKKEMYLLNLPADASRDRQLGVYRLYPNMKVDRIWPVETKNFADYNIQWERTLERFVLAKRAIPGDSLARNDVVLATVNLKETIPLGNLPTDQLFASPDARFYITQAQAGSWALFTAQGKLVQELGNGIPGFDKPFSWLKDSSGFYFYISGQNCSSPFGCIYQFRKDQGWKPALAGVLKGEADKLQVIEP